MNGRWHQARRGTTTTGGTTVRPGVTTTPQRASAGSGQRHPVRATSRGRSHRQPAGSMPSSVADGGNAGRADHRHAATAGALSATAAATTRPEKSFRIDWSPLVFRHPPKLRYASIVPATPADFGHGVGVAMNCCSGTNWFVRCSLRLVARIADFHSAEDGSKPSGSANSLLWRVRSMAGRRVLSAPTWVRIPTPASIFQFAGPRWRGAISHKDRQPGSSPGPATILCLRSSMAERRDVAPENADRNRAQVPDLRCVKGRSLAWPKHPVPTRRSRVRILPPLPARSGRSRPARTQRTRRHRLAR